MHFSIIIPVFNRPDEVDELLLSLTTQGFKDFEVIIVEDGSTITCLEVVEKYKFQLNIHYYDKLNEGPGLTRNFGVEKATGDYFIFFDSDCIIPNNYMDIVSDFLNLNYYPLFGGPDAAAPSFTPIQQAISYSMTSVLTTGGIRGGMKNTKKFHPRSFNMGFDKQVYEKTSGFGKIRFGEDLDLSLRSISLGFDAILIKEAFVYHKRRTDFKKFFKQIHNSGIARINLNIRHPSTLKAIHTLPTVFVIFSILSIILGLFSFDLGLFIIFLYFIAIFFHSLIKLKSIKVAGLSVVATAVQHTAYGTGMIKAVWRRYILRQGEFEAYIKNFYK
ncbi:MAG: glycosyltransferase [Bacteroidota bacterium]|nr:glycosyltransferase [Bacteroidota bacterium]